MVRKVAIILIFLFTFSFTYAQRIKGNFNEKRFNHSSGIKKDNYHRNGIGNGTGSGNGGGGGTGGGNGNGGIGQGGGNGPGSGIPINGGMWILVAGSSFYYFKKIKQSL